MTEDGYLIRDLTSDDTGLTPSPARNDMWSPKLLWDSLKSSSRLLKSHQWPKALINGSTDSSKYPAWLLVHHVPQTAEKDFFPSPRPNRDSSAPLVHVKLNSTSRACSPLFMRGRPLSRSTPLASTGGRGSSGSAVSEAKRGITI